VLRRFKRRKLVVLNTSIGVVNAELVTIVVIVDRNPNANGVRTGVTVTALEHFGNCSTGNCYGCQKYKIKTYKNNIY
jgi:hypothetical protein